MKWLKKNVAEIVFGLGLTIFLLTYFGEDYIISVPLLVVGLLMLYKRHFRTAPTSFFLSDDGDDDDLYEDAKEAVLEAGKASTSYLQRRLRIGYSRAARLIDMLEENEVIGPADGASPRTVNHSKNVAQLNVEK
jgi:DNA segregation ATPase FtsK/SpoIIIE-like protein